MNLNRESLLLLGEIKTFFQMDTALHEFAERFESMAAATIPPDKDCWEALCLQIQKELDKLDTASVYYCAGVAMGVLVKSNKSAASWLVKARELRPN